MDTLFTFLDGALAYDCVRCGQACCRGKGLALDANAELVPLLVKEPRLTPLLSAVPGGLAGWADVTDGCWFLKDDGWCRIETTFERDAKPTTCKLFPFNRVFRAGTVRVVDFNSVICPLFDAQAEGRPGVTYAELLADLAKVPQGPLTHSQAPLPAGAEGRWEALERAILEASRDHLDRPAHRFAAWQAAAAESAIAGKKLGSQPEMVDAIADRFATLERLWAEFHGVPAPDQQSAEAKAIARGLALLGPSLRFNTLFRRGGPPWAQAVLRQPKQLLATAHLGRIAASLAKRSGLRSITELHQNTLPLRELLSRWDEPAVLLTAPNVADAPPPLQQAVLAAAQRLSPFAGAARPLGEVLTETWGALPPPARSLALSLLARSNADLRFAT